MAAGFSCRTTRRGRTKRRTRGSILTSLFAIATAAAFGGESRELTTLPLEDLMRIDIVSASKKAERYADVAAAVYVITSEDIRRSGASTLPEALRLAPGVEVAQITSAQWAITVRGFNSQYATKLLVLVDGRSVYTPAFSGVYWDALDMELDEIDRIEIIRGPGGAVWGMNAVNGVINILTKNAAETTGLRAEVRAGNIDRGAYSARFGGSANGTTHWRAYARSVNRRGYSDLFGFGDEDASDSTRAGFRVDSTRDDDNWTLSGEAHQGHTGTNQYRPKPYPKVFDIAPYIAKNRGTHLVGSWSRNQANGGTMTATAYVDAFEEDDVVNSERRLTASAEWVHRLPRLGTHDVQWGLAFRESTDHITATEVSRLEPDRDKLAVGSVFLQDDVRVSRRIRVIGGMKLEYNGFTGWEPQPTLRTAIDLGRGHNAWAALSEAVRAPSRSSLGIRYDIDSPYDGLATRVTGVANNRAERLLALEAGYRYVGEYWSWDVALYRNRYRNLETAAVDPAGATIETLPAPPYQAVIIPMYLVDAGHATSRGIEFTCDVRPAPAWRVTAAASLMRLDYDLWGEPPLVQPRDDPDDTPRSYWNVRAEYTRGPFDADVTIRHRAALPGVRTLGDLSVGIPAFTTSDVHVAYRFDKHLEFAVRGRNLTGPAHVENVSYSFWITPTPIARSGDVSVTWRY